MTASPPGPSNPGLGNPGPSDRTGRWLRHLGVDPGLLADKATTITIELVADTFADPAVEIAVAMTSTLLLRLADFAPAMHLRVPATRTLALPGLPDAPLLDAIASAHTDFCSLNRLSAAAATDPDLRLVFSGTRDGVAVSTCGWAVSVGTALPAGPGSPIAAAYAGVLAACEAFTTIVSALGVAPARIRPWRGTASLWDYSLTAEPGPPTRPVELGRHVWVGAGGVASAAVWTLAAAGHAGIQLSGQSIVADPDRIDEDATNLNRHLTAGFADLGSDKAGLAVNMLARTGLALDARRARWDQLETSTRNSELAIVTVDDDAARRTVQLDLPREILNAGTGDRGEYRVTRHNFLDGACLGCISRADLTASGPEEALASRLGLPAAALLPHLRSRDPLPDALLKQTTLATVDRAILTATPACQLLERFCGSLALDHGPAVSAPMISASAGVLIAAELAKHNAVERPGLHPGESIFANALRGPHPRWRQPLGKTPDCICTDPLYLRHYKRRWAQK